MIINLGLPQSTKRENVYDSHKAWIDTRPIDVIDLGSKDATTIFKYELFRMNEKDVEEKKTITEEKHTITNQPKLYSNKPKKAKKRIKDHKPKPYDRPKPDE